MLRDLHNNLEANVGLSPQDITSDTTTVGVIIDTQGFHSLEFMITSGTLTDGTYTPLIEDGEDSGLSDAAAVSDANLLGTEAGAAFTASEDDTAKKVGYRGSKRFVRLSIVSASTSSGGLMGAVAIQGHAAKAAVT